jgi:hypothetical protein
MSVFRVLAASLLLAGATAAQPQAPAGETPAEPRPAEESAAAEKPVPLEDVEVILLDAADQRAVLRVGDRPLIVVGPDDEIPGTSATVLSVAADKLVVQTVTPDPPMRVTAWIHREGGHGKGPRVQYLDPRVPVEPPDQVPIVVEQIPEGAPEPTGPKPPFPKRREPPP